MEDSDDDEVMRFLAEIDPPPSAVATQQPSTSSKKYKEGDEVPFLVINTSPEVPENEFVFENDIVEPDLEETASILNNSLKEACSLPGDLRAKSEEFYGALNSLPLDVLEESIVAGVLPNDVTLPQLVCPEGYETHNKHSFRQITRQSPIFITVVWNTIGTHTRCENTYQLLRDDVPLPCAGDKTHRQRLMKLPLLQKITGRVPRPENQTLSLYLDLHQEIIKEKNKTTDYWETYHNLYDGLPPFRSQKILYVDYEGSRYVAYSRTRSLFCVVCKKRMTQYATNRLNQLSNPEGGKDFRACCFESISYTPFRLSMFRTPKKTAVLAYDIETVTRANFQGVRQHKFYVMVSRYNDVKKRHYSLESFFSRIDSIVAELREEEKATAGEAVDIEYDENGRRLPPTPVCLQLVSFNGSRYDDLFLADAWRAHVYRVYGAHMAREDGKKRRGANLKFEYGERKNALTSLNFNVGNVEIRFIDILRFIVPMSLRKACQAFAVPTQKGDIPFGVVNDYVYKQEIKRDTDGFFSLSYFQGDEAKREASKEYYIKVMPPGTLLRRRLAGKKGDDEDVPLLCVLYCEHDVDATYELYYKLDEMYKKYLSGLLPEEKQKDFHPFLLYSLSSMAARLTMHNALTSVHNVYNSNTKSWERKLVEIFVPTKSSYTMERKCVYGGWVKPYYQGLVCDFEKATRLYGEEWLTKLRDLCALLKCPLHDAQLVMGDICSMYPNAVTYMMPVGKPRLVLDEDEKNNILAQLMDCDNPMEIPLFLARVRLEPPSRPMFMESTMPQRDVKENLSWTYRSDFSIPDYGYYTSLDLWIGLKHSMENNDPKTVWKLVECGTMLYYEEGAQIDLKSVEVMSKGKSDGRKEGIKEKADVFKVCLNGFVGKKGQKIDTLEHVLGDGPLEARLKQIGALCGYVGYRDVTYYSGFRPAEAREHVLRVKDPNSNAWPQAEAAFMYAATRLMRLEWSRASRSAEYRALAALNQLPPIQDRTDCLPDPLYGDTDSKIHVKACWDQVPPELQGDVIGMFDESGRSNMNIDLEKVSNADTEVVLTGILGAKAYFMSSVAKKDNAQVLKFKCKGQRQYEHVTHPCHVHDVVACKHCLCEHRSDVYTCVQCIIPALHTQIYSTLEREKEKEGEGVKGALARVVGYKYACLPSLTLHAFLWTLLTGNPCVVLSETFDRTLSLATSKSPEFTVKTEIMSRTLSRPRIAHTLMDVIEGFKEPHLSGLVQLSNTLAGVLHPVGDYIEFNI